MKSLCSRPPKYSDVQNTCSDIEEDRVPGGEATPPPPRAVMAHALFCRAPQPQSEKLSRLGASETGGEGERER